MGTIRSSDIISWKGHSMKGHRYRVTIEHVGAPKAGEPLRDALTFETMNHDEILAIVERLRASRHYEADEAAALAIGLKLFSEVMLKRRDDPLFAEVRPAIRAFIGALKDRNKAAMPAPA